MATLGQSKWASSLVSRSRLPRPPRRQLHPLPRGIVELYSLIAVLVVLIPEWLAEGTLLLNPTDTSELLQINCRAWRRLPELWLAGMPIRDLRQLAQERGILGYAADGREELTRQLLHYIDQQRQDLVA